jgi:hypothetical protein
MGAKVGTIKGLGEKKCDGKSFFFPEIPSQYNSTCGKDHPAE